MPNGYTLRLMVRIGVFASVVCLFVCQQAGAIDKEGLLSKYRDKFVVVVSEGLRTGMCEVPPYILIDDLGKVELKAPFSGCGTEPMHKGEVLKASHVAFSGGYLFIELKNLSPHSVTRGIGAFAHESMEMGSIKLRFRAADGKDFDRADALVAQWLKPFDTVADAAKFGNTASGVFVNQVKLGMSFAEVELALGLPQTRVELGEKVLYKYKDMTVEFHDGKVADVR